MIEENTPNTLYHLEGPERYTPNEVASAFSQASNKSVTILEIQEQKWNETFKSAGFSDEAAASYQQMTKATISENFRGLSNSFFGDTTIRRYIHSLVENR
jgi:uncharacterized protein YbjT (DUF2867 family)